MGVGLRFTRDVTTEKRNEASLIAKSDELGRANMRFDAALNNMSQGLSMYDAEQRLVVANRRFSEIYGLTPDQTKPGTTARQVLEYRIATGTYAGVRPDDYISKVFREPSTSRHSPTAGSYRSCGNGCPTEACSRPTKTSPIGG